MDKTFTLISKLIKHDLITGSFYVFLGFIFISLFSFLFNLFLARSLSYSNYGIYSSLLSVFTLATIPAASLGVVVVRFATSYFSNNETDKLSAFYKKMLALWTLVGIILFTIFIGLSPLISSFLRIDNHLAITVVGLSIGISYIGISNNSFLQALTKFKSLSVVGVLGTLAKLILGVGFVLKGLSVVGATAALLVAPLVTFILALFPLKFLINHKSSSKIQFHTKEMVRYGVPASITILFLSSYISSDVILVKHFFSTTQAGYYGGLSLIGKVIFYFTGPIPMVMFPLLIKRDAIGGNVKNLLYLSVILVLLPSVFITGFYYFFPDFVVKFFLGGRDYLKIVPYLGIFGIFLSIYSVNNILINFFLSLKKTMIVYFVGIGALIQIALILNFHKDFIQVIHCSIISSIFLFVILLLYYIKVYGFHNSKK